MGSGRKMTSKATMHLPMYDLSAFGQEMLTTTTDHAFAADTDETAFLHQHRTQLVVLWVKPTTQSSLTCPEPWPLAMEACATDTGSHADPQCLW